MYIFVTKIYFALKFKKGLPLYYNMDINNIYEYFFKIDKSQDGVLQKEEVQQAKKEISIFSAIIEEDMSYDTFCTLAVKECINQSRQNGTNPVYSALDNPPDAQDWEWESISRVLTKEEVDADVFNIKTREGQAVDPNINFNSEDGAYMLKHLSFDKETFKNTPPENLPENFKPEEIFELGKQAGQNVDKMHDLGYTGKNITVAVVDTPIIVHDDIKSSLVKYEVMDAAKTFDIKADFHGQATSDLLSGDEAGAAPDSSLVYFATLDNANDGLQALKRIIEINKNAKPEDKIKVVSLSWGFNEGMLGYEEFRSLLKELYDDNVFVVTADFNMLDKEITGTEMPYGALEKKEQAGNPNDFSNYTALNMFGDLNPEKTLFFASGDRTVASARDKSRFRHDSQASTSWTVPTVAGIYTCALQCADENGVKLTPAKFWEYALKTGMDVFDENGIYAGKAVDAEALVHYIEDLGKENQSNFGI